MLFILKKLYGDQSLVRILMNIGFRQFTLSGLVVDVGGGRSPDYFDYFDRAKVTSIEPLDGSISKINFEKDTLPYADASVDSIVCANVLEHVYEHRHLVGEMHRMLKDGGQLIGFVPFLIQYHPDPHDYFRYTKEALMLIFTAAGFKDVRIKETGGGPFAANFNNIVLSVPLVVRVFLFPFYWSLDRLFLKIRPKVRERYPLGYLFSMKK
jgi:SAM-dependent methyltransferase